MHLTALDTLLKKNPTITFEDPHDIKIIKNALIIASEHDIDLENPKKFDCKTIDTLRFYIDQYKRLQWLYNIVCKSESIEIDKDRKIDIYTDDNGRDQLTGKMHEIKSLINDILKELV